MKKYSLILSAAVLLACSASAQDKKKALEKTVDSVKKVIAPPAKASITDKIKSSKKIDGLFTLYQDTLTGSLQLYVKKIA